MSKVCTRCRMSKPLTSFHKHKSRKDGLQTACIECKGKDPSQSTEEKRRRHLMRKYGITEQDFQVLLAAQGGLCAICGVNEPGGQYNTWHVDHCHESGNVRGLLCNNCNLGLGYFKDNLEALQRALKYLEEASCQTMAQ